MKSNIFRDSKWPCPRCGQDLPNDAQKCPNCKLVLPSFLSEEDRQKWLEQVKEIVRREKEARKQEEQRRKKEEELRPQEELRKKREQKARQTYDSKIVKERSSHGKINNLKESLEKKDKPKASFKKAPSSRKTIKNIPNLTINFLTLSVIFSSIPTILSFISAQPLIKFSNYFVSKFSIYIRPESSEEFIFWASVVLFFPILCGFCSLVSIIPHFIFWKWKNNSKYLLSIVSINFIVYTVFCFIYFFIIWILIYVIGLDSFKDSIIGWNIYNKSILSTIIFFSTFSGVYEILTLNYGEFYQNNFRFNWMKKIFIGLKLLPEKITN